MKFALTVAAFAASAVLVSPTAAEASRPIATAQFADQCPNLRGTQTIMAVHLRRVVVRNDGTCSRVERGDWGRPAPVWPKTFATAL